MNAPVEPYVAPIEEWGADPPLWIGDGRSLDSRGFFWGADVRELVSAPASRIGQLPLDIAGTSQIRV